jgi:glycosyltransferase involved in cell wall biosynthesis
MTRPLLAVCLITYNHARYIKQAFDSILAQKTTFEFEIIVADDCSTDGTTDIVKGYEKKYPGKIRTIIHEKNIGPAQNYLTLLQAVKSKYTAYLEGDDYWIDETKLQQQVKFLESNPTYSLCFHNLYNLENGKRKKAYFIEIPDTTDINYLLSHRGYITTSTIVYRTSSHIIEMLTKLIDCPFGDFVTYVAAAQQGLIKYLSTPMAIYRVHDAGNWTSLEFDKIFEKATAAYRMLFAVLPPKQAEMLKVRYLLLLETYFLQEKARTDEKKIMEILIPEMNIDPYIIQYLVQYCEERKNPSNYTFRLPYKVLVKTLFQKFQNQYLSR